MACCDKCGNYDGSAILESDSITDPECQPDLYYYWQYPLEEDYLMPNNFDCLCEICFDILNQEGKIKWKEGTV